MWVEQISGIRGGRRGMPLEGTASRRNDATLMPDEIREVDGRRRGISFICWLTGRAARARTDGSVRETKLLESAVSGLPGTVTGEHAASAGERTYAGAEVRMIQIPSDSGNMACLKNFMVSVAGKPLAEHLEQHVAHYHGAHHSATGCIAWPLICRNWTSQAKAFIERVYLKADAGKCRESGYGLLPVLLWCAMAGEWPQKRASGRMAGRERPFVPLQAVWLHGWLTGVIQLIRKIKRHLNRFGTLWRVISSVGLLTGMTTGTGLVSNDGDSRKVDKGDNATEPVVTFYVLRQAGRRSVRIWTRVRGRCVWTRAGWKPGEDGRTQNSIRLPEIGL